MHALHGDTTQIILFYCSKYSLHAGNSSNLGILVPSTTMSLLVLSVVTHHWSSVRHTAQQIHYKVIKKG